jgi:hypothetical protein
VGPFGRVETFLSAPPGHPPSLRRSWRRLVVAALGSVILVCPMLGGVAHGTPAPVPTLVAAPPTAASALYDLRLTRAPYLTDLVGLHVTVNFGTDRSGLTATVQYGPVSAGVCTLTTTVSATRLGIAVNAAQEYQWKAPITLPQAGQYCYRPFLGATDLLGAATSPQFTSQVPVGSTEPFSFAVFGDWGQVDASGANAVQAGVMSQIAASGSRFAITVGDNAYPSGSQGNYGDLQQVGANTGAVFGPAGWPVAGSSIPVFPAVGNHGLSRSDAVHPQFANWPADAAVSGSNGRYQIDTYCCANGSASANYPSAWYAFDAGGARFYVLDAAWADQNIGTATPYANEYLSHWSPGSPEYQWLQADLAAHPSGLKFAFFHYPLYSDQPSENSDPYLQGNGSLEGLLAANGVDLAFSGHAHIYERSSPATGAGRLSLPSYVTGGGGAQAQSTGACSPNDQYAIGWSYSKSRGTKCGSAPAPTSPAQVAHFLQVTVSGSTVTVTPTDSTGRTFDIQTYSFTPPPDTYLDSGPPAGTTSTSATFSFHASAPSATFSCTLDTGGPQPCTSPITYDGLAEGSHTFSVDASVNGVADPVAATSTWTVDTSPPQAPTNFAAAAASPFSVSLSWTAAVDDVGVTGYQVLRDGALLATVPPSTAYTDATVLAGSTHVYAVLALDAAGNTSPPTPSIQVITPFPPAPVFADGFESGGLGSWTSSGGLVVESSTVNSGTFAAEGNTTTGSTYAKKQLPSTYPDAYGRVWYDLLTGSSQVSLMRFRSATGVSIGYLYLATSGQLGFHNDATGTNTLSATVPAPGWHALELHELVAGPGGTVEVWLDNTLVSDLSQTVNTGTSPVATFQIGDVQTARIYDVVLDDAAFGTSRLGPLSDGQAPTVPTNLAATPTSPFSVNLTWDPSTDSGGVAGYDVFRDGAPLASLGAVTSYGDAMVLPSSTHTYQVRARDVAGNLSDLTAPVSATTPAATPPSFLDGFETGDLSAWTASAGLVVGTTAPHSGTFAAEGNTTNGNTYAKKTLPGTYADAYAQIAYDLKSQASQVNLLRMRDATGVSIGYAFLTTTGRLAFHDDATNQNLVSSTVPGAGWHTLQLHLSVQGASSLVEVWLDGAAVSALSVPVTLGTQPVGILQIGETQTGRTYDVVFDDVGFGSQRLGSFDTTPPTPPATTTAVANSAFSVQLSWAAASDDTGVTGYDVLRDGVVLASLPPVTTYTDGTASPSTTYAYTVRARDLAGNVSVPGPSAVVATGPPPVPVFADGFESGDLSAWTTSGGLTIESTAVRSGAFGAEAATTNGNTYAKKTLAATYASGYGRVAFDVISQAGQINLLRMRDATAASLGYVYLTTGGQLAFHNDATGTNTVSGVIPGTGWHSVELHLVTNGASSVVEVWLDGLAVSALSGPTTLGSGPIGAFQIGDTQTGRTYDVVFDDAAFGDQRLGP